MSEVLRNTAYVNTRILIESARILDPQFDGAVVYITGAQIELLRNVTQYLDRVTTFVYEYEQDYYIVPDSDDWDTITTIVANLEEKLMGNENVIFGYYANLFEDLSGDVDQSGNYAASTSTPPTDQIYMVQLVSIIDRLNDASRIRVRVDEGTDQFVIHQATTPGVNVPVVYSDQFMLKNGQKVIIEVLGSDPDDPIKALVLGYKMQVPV